MKFAPGNMPDLTEDQIHRAVVARLRVSAKPGVLPWHTPNDAKRSWGNISRLKAMGMVAGVPDLMIVHNGEIFGREIKARKGRVTPAQTEFQERLIAAGGYAMTGYGEDECLSFLSNWGLLR